MATPFDRNQRARQEQMSAQQRLQRQQFAEAFAAGQAPVLDRFGNVVTKDSLVLWHSPMDQVYQVVDVAPVLDPNAPAGIVRITLQMQVPLQYPAGMQARDLALVGQVTSPGHAEVTGPRMVTLTDGDPDAAAREAEDRAAFDHAEADRLAPPPTGDSER